jgi:hypothetical protein
LLRIAEDFDGRGDHVLEMILEELDRLRSGREWLNVGERLNRRKRGKVKEDDANIIF